MSKKIIKPEKPKDDLPPTPENLYAAELIAAYRAGDKQAFALLCKIYWKWMKSQNYFFYNNDEKAEEATDDQLLILAVNLLKNGKYTELFKFEGYLRNLVRNNQHIDPKEFKTIEYNENAKYNDGEKDWDIDVIMEEGEFKLESNEGDDIDFEMMTEGYEYFENDDRDDANSIIMHAAIAKLETEDRDIISMRDLHGLSWKLIGGILDLTANTVSSRHFKIIKKIKKIIENKKYL